MLLLICLTLDGLWTTQLDRSHGLKVKLIQEIPVPTMENMTRSAWDFEDSLGGDVEQRQDPPSLNCSQPPCFRLLTLSWPRMNSDVMSSNQVVGRP